MFPADNIWNTRVDTLPVHPNSVAYTTTMGGGTGLHPDFGSGTWDGGPIGIPYTIVAGSQISSSVVFTYADESDGPLYPIPSNAPREWGSDHHILIVEKDHCKLYELYAADKDTGSWRAGSGAIFDLRSHALRPDTWTSADAAGLPILPGLARYDEVAAGVIKHALRFTVNCTSGYIWPARHEAPHGSCATPAPMGLRLRLKASYTIPAGYSTQTKIILQALKTYGMIVADNGSNWYISGAPDAGWDDDSLVSQLSQVKGSNFEVVDESSLMINADSGQAVQP
jgi:hypothetical protein